MAFDRPDYSHLQAYFLLRAAHLGNLEQSYRYGAWLTDTERALIRWALRSTLADCARLGVEREARLLARGGAQR